MCKRTSTNKDQSLTLFNIQQSHQRSPTIHQSHMALSADFVRSTISQHPDCLHHRARMCTLAEDMDNLRDYFCVPVARKAWNNKEEKKILQVQLHTLD
mmetsp:Transcript_41370/g.84595  ORF Transcript_41370/g.84595 Transcript_41370/m.84595 type:complete len:98 (-) Transcript_41370:186-479(-)